MEANWLLGSPRLIFQNNQSQETTKRCQRHDDDDRIDKSFKQTKQSSVTLTKRLNLRLRPYMFFGRVFHLQWMLRTPVFIFWLRDKMIGWQIKEYQWCISNQINLPLTQALCGQPNWNKLPDIIYTMYYIIYYMLYTTLYYKL